MGHTSFLNAILYSSIGLMTVTASLTAQDIPGPDQAPHAWRRADAAQPDQAPPQQQPAWAADQNGAPDQGPPPPPNFSANQQGNYPQGNYPQGNYPPPQQRQQPMRQDFSVPPQLTIKPGTFVSIRMNQGLSSDHSQQGDTFYATLAQPLIVDGVIVAQRGETVMGRVTEAQKAGRVEGTSRLGVELTGLTLADGQQVSIQSQMINRNGSTSVGRDVGAIGTTTALGAAIGAGADWGRGAAIGAGAGAAAGILGVLLTRGRPTIIYPESVLTFRIASPVNVATDRAPQAFRFVSEQDYNRNAYAQGPPPRYAAQAPPVYAPAPYYYGYGGYYPYYGGSAFSLYFGPSFYGGYRGGFYYRGFRR